MLCVAGLVGQARLERVLSGSKPEVLAVKRPVAATAIAGGANYLMFGMEIELIDTIRKLDETSTQLARVGIGIGVLAVVLTLVQVLRH